MAEESGAHLESGTAVVRIGWTPLGAHQPVRDAVRRAHQCAHRWCGALPTTAPVRRAGRTEVDSTCGPLHLVRAQRVTAHRMGCARCTPCPRVQPEAVRSIGWRINPCPPTSFCRHPPLSTSATGPVKARTGSWRSAGEGRSLLSPAERAPSQPVSGVHGADEVVRTGVAVRSTEWERAPWCAPGMGVEPTRCAPGAGGLGAHHRRRRCAPSCATHRTTRARWCAGAPSPPG